MVNNLRFLYLFETQILRFYSPLNPEIVEKPILIVD
jgi:hypothetical protein